MENLNLSQVKERYLPRTIIIGIVLVIIAILVSLGSIFLTNFFPPKVIATKPIDGSSNVTPFTNILITFDHPIPISIQSHFSISPSVDGSFSIVNNSLQFTPSQHLSLGQMFTVTVNSPASYWGKAGSSVTFSFTVKTINELTMDESYLLQAESDRLFKQEVQNASQTTDFQKGVAIYNLIQATPFDGVNFSVSYDKPIDTFVVTIKQNPYQTNKQAALSWIQGQGLSDLSWINIKYVSGSGVGP
jgi:hypothetical protein